MPAPIISQDLIDQTGKPFGVPKQEPNLGIPFGPPEDAVEQADIQSRWDNRTPLYKQPTILC